MIQNISTKSATSAAELALSSASKQAQNEVRKSLEGCPNNGICDWGASGNANDARVLNPTLSMENSSLIKFVGLICVDVPAIGWVILQGMAYFDSTMVSIRQGRSIDFPS